MELELPPSEMSCNRTSKKVREINWNTKFWLRSYESWGGEAIRGIQIVTEVQMMLNLHI